MGAVAKFKLKRKTDSPALELLVMLKGVLNVSPAMLKLRDGVACTAPEAKTAAAKIKEPRAFVCFILKICVKNNYLNYAHTVPM